MAIFQSGALVGPISGNLHGVNFVHARGSQVVRAAIFTSDRATQAQLQRRALMANVTERWRDADLLVREAWTKAAASMLFKSRLGLPRHLSPLQLIFKMVLAGSPPGPIIPLEAPNLEILPAPVSVSAVWRVGAFYDVTLPFPAPVPIDFHQCRISRPFKPYALRNPKNWRLLPINAEHTGTNNWRPFVLDIYGELLEGEVVSIRMNYMNFNQLSQPGTRLDVTLVP